jgi:two-component system, NtrC family, nitrogen regulation response regulator GlnG
MYNDATTFDFSRAERHACAAPGAALIIAWHPDASRIGQSATLGVKPGATQDLSRKSPVFEDGEPLADPRVSRAPLQILFRPDGGVELWPGRSGLRFTVGGVPGRAGQVISAEDLAVGVPIGLGSGSIVILEVGERCVCRPRYELVGVSSAMEHLRCEIDRVGPHLHPALILGESGSGKEVVARALHATSPRADRPFVAVNMAAIPASTAASQLFGHARGAFTGANTASNGYFGQAKGGTLFLDEIGACPPEVQAQLLRALDAQEIQPVGGRIQRADVRVLAATDEALDIAVAQGRFRAPLLYRLAQEELHVPPLRNRIADISAQLVYFLSRELGRQGAAQQLGPAEAGERPWLSRDVIEQALAHPWPGNTRELKAQASRMASRFGTEAHCEWAGPVSLMPPPEPAAQEAAHNDPGMSNITEALRRCDFQLKATARALGIAPNTLRKRMDDQGIPRPATLSEDQIRDALRQAGTLDQAARTLGVSKTGLRHRATTLGIAQER